LGVLAERLSVASQARCANLYRLVFIILKLLWPRGAVSLPSTSDRACTPHDAASTPHDAASTPRDAASTPRDAASTPRDAASTPRDAASTPRDAASTPRDAASTLNRKSTDKASPQGAAQRRSAKKDRSRPLTRDNLAAKIFLDADLHRVGHDPCSFN
jgi:hypothetical protein